MLSVPFVAYEHFPSSDGARGQSEPLDGLFNGPIMSLVPSSAAHCQTSAHALGSRPLLSTGTFAMIVQGCDNEFRRPPESLN